MTWSRIHPCSYHDNCQLMISVAHSGDMMVTYSLLKVHTGAGVVSNTGHAAALTTQLHCDVIHCYHWPLGSDSVTATCKILPFKMRS